MKRLLFLIVGGFSLMNADWNCLDNSKHLNTCDGYDYKKYEPVYDCDCPCYRWPQDFDRGRCLSCGHYRAPEPIIYVDRPRECSE